MNNGVHGLRYHDPAKSSDSFSDQHLVEVQWLSVTLAVMPAYVAAARSDGFTSSVQVVHFKFMQCANMTCKDIASALGTR